MKRTTIRLDAALRARLADFSASETLSVQALLTRALKRHLPALTVEQPMAHNQGLPRAAGARAMRRSVRFDPHLYWRLKTAAGKRGRSMQSIMVAALEAYLDAFEADGETQKAAHLSVVA